jgi:Bacterial aa3 type cytochrome c oxidase subunit IV
MAGSADLSSCITLERFGENLGKRCELAFERHAAMADTLHDPQLAPQELREHEQTFHSFSKLVLFAILHIMVVLSCLALAFLGNAPLIALILGVGGTAMLLAAFAFFV